MHCFCFCASEQGKVSIFWMNDWAFVWTVFIVKGTYAREKIFQSAILNVHWIRNGSLINFLLQGFSAIVCFRQPWVLPGLCITEQQKKRLIKKERRRNPRAPRANTNLQTLPPCPRPPRAVGVEAETGPDEELDSHPLPGSTVLLLAEKSKAFPLIHRSCFHIHGRMYPRGLLFVLHSFVVLYVSHLDADSSFEWEGISICYLAITRAMTYVLNLS